MRGVSDMPDFLYLNDQTDPALIILKDSPEPQVGSYSLVFESFVFSDPGECKIHTDTITLKIAEYSRALEQDPPSEFSFRTLHPKPLSIAKVSSTVQLGSG